MRKLLHATRLAVVVGIGALACYPERPSQPNDYASVTTVFDTLMRFDSVTTFYVPDSVVHLGDPDNINHAYDSLIIARVAANMVARGYTQVFDVAVDDPDLTLNPAVTVVDNYVIAGGDWCLIWGWAYPWLCTGWIPIYPPDVIGYVYSSGTILIAMADLSDGVPPGVSRPPVVWLAGINGVVSDMTSAELEQGITNGINQAFLQSPYIGRVNP
jgi:hypothetical protein